MRIRPAVVLVPLLALTACADAPTGSGAGPGIEHATGPSDLLVRVAYEGGFVPVEWHLTSIPTFSLYGDGTIVLPGAQIEIYPGPALPAISSRPVSEAGIQAILEEALAATESVPGTVDDLGSVAIADAPWTVITVNAGGVERTIKVYALAEAPERPDGMPEEVYRARQRLGRFVTKIGNLQAWLPSGSLGEETTFDPDSARLLVSDYRKVDELSQERIDWPLDGALAGFGEPTEPATYRCGTLEGSDWTAVRDAAGRANQLTPWTDEGQRFSVLFRPLLPDESGC
jgi:hypothetical protein